MSDYEIENGIPMPSNAVSKKTRRIKYPFAAMKIMDSFFVPCEDTKESETKTWNKISACLRNYNEKQTVHSNKIYQGHIFTKEGSIYGCRVWRVDPT